MLPYLPECGDPESLRWSNGPQRNRLGECLRGCTNLNGPRPLAKFCKSKSDSDPDSDESNPSNKLFEVDDPIFRPEVEAPETEAANAADVDDLWPCSDPSYMCRQRILGSSDNGSGRGILPNSEYPLDDKGLKN